MGTCGQQRVRLRDRFIRVAAEVVSVGAGVMRGNALVAFGIAKYGLLGIDVAQQLRLHPQKSRLERGVDRLGPRRVALQLHLQRLNAFG